MFSVLTISPICPKNIRMDVYIVYIYISHLNHMTFNFGLYTGFMGNQIAIKSGVRRKACPNVTLF